MRTGIPSGPKRPRSILEWQTPANVSVGDVIEAGPDRWRIDEIKSGGPGAALSAWVIRLGKAGE